MWLVTILCLMLEMWTSGPGCNGACNQGRRVCTCRKR